MRMHMTGLRMMRIAGRIIKGSRIVSRKKSILVTNGVVNCVEFMVRYVYVIRKSNQQYLRCRINYFTFYMISYIILYK